MVPTDLTELMAQDTADEDMFITVDAPTDSFTESKAADPDGKYCVVCGTDVSGIYKRRMKEYRCEDHKKTGGASKLGTGTGTRRGSSKDVEAAVNALESWYTLLGLGLFMGGATQASNALAESIPDLSEKNQTYLSQAPALAKRIADMGKTSAMYGFFSAQVMVLAPVAILATGELVEKWGKPKQRNAEDFDEDLPGMVNGIPVG